MTKDDLIRMVKEADDAVCFEEDEQAFYEHFAALVAAAERKTLRDEIWEKSMKLVSEAVKYEREACAKVCDRDDSMRWSGAADAIRARSQS